MDTRIIHVLTLLLSTFVLSTSNLTAQVTIGANVAPSAGALLELKEFEPTSTNANAYRGLGMPRVALSSLVSLAPTFIGTPTELIKDKHTGLVVYNVTNQVSENLCEGLYVWDGSSWIRLHGKCDPCFVVV